MSDTSATVKLRWHETVLRVVEAEVSVDELPDELIAEGDDDQWSIVTGEVDSHEVSDFLEGLDIENRAVEMSTEVEVREVLDAEHVAPIMVTAAPIAVVDLRFPEGSGLEAMEEYARDALVEEFTPEAVEVTGISECERLGDHQQNQDHRWQECPAYHGEGAIE